MKVEESQVWCCDFSRLMPPEMCKHRAIVIMSCSPARPNLAIVVPFSRSRPTPPKPWHHKLSDASKWDKLTRWAKCDMIYAVAFERLTAWKLPGRDSNGKRRYLRNFKIAQDDFLAIQDGVLNALKIKRPK